MHNLPTNPIPGRIAEIPFVRIAFQDGIPALVGLNGVRVQDVLSVAIEQLKKYQAGPLACVENEQAIRSVAAAIHVLDERIHRREIQGVLNTYEPHDTRRTEDEIEDFSATGG